MNEAERDSSTLVKDDCENKNSNSDYPQLTYPEYSPQSLASLTNVKTCPSLQSSLQSLAATTHLEKGISTE